MVAFAQAIGGSKGPDPFLSDEAQKKPVDDRAKSPPPRPEDKNKGLDPVAISKAANQIFHGMEGVGTNEKDVLSALQGRSPEEIAALRQVFTQRFGKSLDAEIANEMGGKELEAAKLALAGDRLRGAAATIEAAVDGFGANAALVNDTLRSLPDEESRKAVVEEFKKRTGKNLKEVLDDELSGRNKEQAQLLMNGKRAEAAAVRLMGAMEGAGTDEAALNGTLEGLKTKEERQAVFDAFEKRTGTSIDKAILDETSGTEFDVATSLSVGDTAGAKAGEARLAMEGPGTSEQALRETLEGTTAAEAGEIRSKYAEKGGDIDADLKGELGPSDRLEIDTMLPKEAGPKFGSPEFEKLLDETTNSKAHEGNETEMLFDGINSFRERMELISKATGTICLQTFIFNSDATGWAMATRLAAKAKEGVKVRVMVDAVGSGRADEKMFDFMREAGVEVRVYAPLTEDPLSANHRSHEKQLIIDGQESIQGGMNIADEYALGGSGLLVKSRNNEEPWRDADIRMRGPSVADGTAAFLKQWNDLGEDVPKEDSEKMMQPPAPVEGGASVRVVHNRPDKDGTSNIENLYVNSIRSATSSITIENAYFIPSEEMRQELIAAAKRGVKVRVMTNSEQSNDNHMVAEASRFFYDELVAAGVQIVEKQGGTLHAKTATFDGEYSIVGSANLNGRSRECDSEIVLAVADPTVAGQIEKRFDDGLEKTKGVKMEELANEELSADAKQALFSRAAKIF